MIDVYTEVSECIADTIQSRKDELEVLECANVRLTAVLKAYLGEVN